MLLWSCVALAVLPFVALCALAARPDKSIEVETRKKTDRVE